MSDERVKTSDVEQVSWNLAEQIIMQIGNLLQNGTNNFLHGKLSACFYNFREIRLLIFSSLNETEKIKLSELEKKFSEIQFYLDDEILRTRLTRDTYSKIKSGISEKKVLANELLQTYRENIITLLSKYGYHISRKEDSTRMF